MNHTSSDCFLLSHIVCSLYVFSLSKSSQRPRKVPFIFPDCIEVSRILKWWSSFSFKKTAEEFSRDCCVFKGFGFSD